MVYGHDKPIDQSPFRVEMRQDHPYGQNLPPHWKSKRGARRDTRFTRVPVNPPLMHQRKTQRPLLRLSTHPRNSRSVYCEKSPSSRLLARGRAGGPIHSGSLIGFSALRASAPPMCPFPHSIRGNIIDNQAIHVVFKFNRTC